MAKEDKIVFCTGGGCTAKLGAGVLSHILEKLPRGEKDPDLLVGYDSQILGSQYVIATVDIAVSSFPVSTYVGIAGIHGTEVQRLLLQERIVGRTVAVHTRIVGTQFGQCPFDIQWSLHSSVATDDGMLV